MNYCPRSDKITEYCLGVLVGKEKEDFEKHLGSCKKCQYELEVEKALRAELSEEFNPGFIEGKLRMRMELLGAQDIRSFWLYTFRMAVTGISAAIAGFVLIPMLVRFLFGFSPSLSQCGQAVAEFLGKLAPGSAFLAVLGAGYVAVFIISMYSLAQIRR